MRIPVFHDEIKFTFFILYFHQGVLKSIQQKINLPPVVIELITLAITGSEIRWLFNWANQTCITWETFN